MSTYFSYFQPFINYQGKIVTDITKRAKIREVLKDNVYVFLPYTVQEGDRPEDVSYLYYGKPDYTWLIYLANDIIDPYHQWVMNQDVFESYLIKKYTTQSGKEGREVLDWCKNKTITENIVMVYHKDDDEKKISPYTFLNSPNIVFDDWVPLRVFEYEEILNENKRHINLVNATYLDNFVTELATIMRN